MEPELEAETSGGLRGEAAAGLDDYFSRQRAVPDWHQPLLDGQVALLLGVGGVGCSVARNLWWGKEMHLASSVICACTYVHKCPCTCVRSSIFVEFPI